MRTARASAVAELPVTAGWTRLASTDAVKTRAAKRRARAGSTPCVESANTAPSVSAQRDTR